MTRPGFAVPGPRPLKASRLLSPFGPRHAEICAFLVQVAPGNLSLVPDQSAPNVAALKRVPLEFFPVPEFMRTRKISCFFIKGRRKRMDQQELRRRYCAGERRFEMAYLQGEILSALDLREVELPQADLRGDRPGRSK